MAATKRTDYLTWDDYFMAVAFLSAKRSKDPSLQLGACIVSPDKKIVGIGYNGMPNGCDDDKLPWGKSTSDPLESKDLYLCAAEMNAILNKNAASVNGCTMYVPAFPTNEMAKLIIQAGIKSVIYMSDTGKDGVPFVAARKLFDMAKVSYKPFTPRQQTITIDFGAFASPAAATTTASSSAPAANPAPSSNSTNASIPSNPPEKLPAAVSTDSTGKSNSVKSPVDGKVASQSPEVASTPTKPALVTPESPADSWFAKDMPMQQCIKNVGAAQNGDFLIAEKEENRVLIVKDEDVVRSYTLKSAGDGRWNFGGRVYPSLRSIVKLLKKTPIRSTTGKMINLGNPAAGGVVYPETEAPGAVVQPLPQTPGGTAQEEEGCVVM